MNFNGTGDVYAGDKLPNSFAAAHYPQLEGAKVKEQQQKLFGVSEELFMSQVETVVARREELERTLDQIKMNLSSAGVPFNYAAERNPFKLLKERVELMVDMAKTYRERRSKKRPRANKEADSEEDEQNTNN